MNVSYVILFLFGISTTLFAQNPFDCNGKTYRVIEKNGGTMLQAIHLNESTPFITFEDLHFFSAYKINAIAYHPEQDVIYGIIQNPPFRLCRIDADFKLDILATLPLSEKMEFVSGDIAPNAQHLVVLGFAANESQLVSINLNHNQYETKQLTFQTTDPTNAAIHCADIAFHPTTGVLFGFDHQIGRLVTIDLAEKRIDNAYYPAARKVSGNMPSIFFTSEGQLYGIGAPNQSASKQRNLYQFDLADGQATLLQEIGLESNQDACSCPYKIQLFNKVQHRAGVPCTEMLFELTFINKTNTEQQNLILTDTFSDGMEIKSINKLPYGAVIKSGVGTNFLNITDLYLPIGTYTIEVEVAIKKEMPHGFYVNQAHLSNLVVEKHPDWIVSDDPITVIPNDATAFSIETLKVWQQKEELHLCEGQSLTLSTDIKAALQYEWSNGATTETITVSKPGDYTVIVRTACAFAVDTIKVKMDAIELELGADQTLERGNSIQLIPNYSTHSPIQSFFWEASIQQSIDCQTCANPTASPRADTKIELWVENETGCQASDQLLLKVTDLAVYSPNVFSPNNDGQNDLFFLQSNLTYEIAHFQIFDRWGNLLFQNINGQTNQAYFGWDGHINGAKAAIGTYVWKAEILKKSGDVELIRGDVLLVR